MKNILNHHRYHNLKHLFNKELKRTECSSSSSKFSKIHPKTNKRRIKTYLTLKTHFKKTIPLEDYLTNRWLLQTSLASFQCFIYLYITFLHFFLLLLIHFLSDFMDKYSRGLELLIFCYVFFSCWGFSSRWIEVL